MRCLAPTTHRLAEAMPSYAAALAPVVETVAGILGEASPYDVTVPSVLSGAKHKAAARRRAAAEREAVVAVTRRGPGVPGLAPRGKRRRPEPDGKSTPLPLAIRSWPTIRCCPRVARISCPTTRDFSASPSKSAAS